MAEPTLDRVATRSDGAAGITAALPVLAAIEERLRAGARVAELGCDDGRYLVGLARSFPSSTFHGFGVDRARIAAARVAAAEAGVSDRVTFEHVTDDRLPGESYDLVCTFGAHERLARSPAAPHAIHEALAPHGTWLHIGRTSPGRA